MAQTSTITVRLPVSVKKRLEQLSLSTERSKAYLAARAIEEYLKINEWQVKAIEEALKDADSKDANFVAHEDVLKLVKKKAKEHEDKMAEKIGK